MSLQKGILGLLTLKPMTGYELKSLFDNSINYFWAAQQSQIYRELGALENKGYVTSRIEPQTGKPDKKVYTITPQGDEALQTWLNTFPAKLSMAIRDEITLRIFFGDRIDPEELKFQLKKLVKEKQEVLEVLRAMNEACKGFMTDIGRDKDAFFKRLTIKKGLLVFEAEVRWAEECLKDIEGLQADIRDTV